MNLEKLKDSARKYEQKEDWRRAIDVYLKAIHEFESGKDQHPDLSLYNRVGDLYMKVADTAAAVRSYERAADLYTEQGFLNNAIALCGKILRVNPSRTQIYFKLAQIHARKNMVVDAKRHLIEFLERMNRGGQLDEAFASVKIFADQFSQNQDIRLMLIDLLRAASRDEEALEQLEKMAQELEARGDRVGARRTREKMEEIESGQEGAPLAPTPALGAGDGLVFLDTGGAVSTPPRVPTAEAPPAAPALERVEVLPVGGSLEFLDVGSGASAIEESAGPESLGLEVPPTPVVPAEASTMLLGDIELTSVETAGADAVERLDGFESGEVEPPTGETGGPSFDLMLEPAFETGEIESRPLEGLELVGGSDDGAFEGRAGTPEASPGIGDEQAFVVEVSEAEAEPMALESLEAADEPGPVLEWIAEPEAAESLTEPHAGGWERATDEAPGRDGQPAADAGDVFAGEEPPVARAGLEDPLGHEVHGAHASAAGPADLEPHEPHAAAEAPGDVAEAHESTGAPIGAHEGAHDAWAATDAAVDGRHPSEHAPEAPADERGLLAGLELIETPTGPGTPAAVPSVEELEDRILENPDDPERHRELAEALLVQGDTGRAVEELELAMAGYEQADDLSQADGILALLITLSPDAVRYYQKRVEHAYRRGDRDQLLGAYLDLGDVLARMQAVDKAAAVYGRVLEHEPENARARLALQLIGVMEEPAEAAADGAGVHELAGQEPAAAPEGTAPEPAARDAATGRVTAEAAAPSAPTPAPAPVPPPYVPRALEPTPPPRPRDVPVEAGFVDLGSLVIEPEGARDTRMTGEQLEPTGDEDRDFREMLAQFRKGIDDNVALDDYEAHYDLGVAFKEMGLYDEAVAEFQKALRAPEGRLRTSEALGICFYEKGQVPVAEAVLRRAVDALPGGDEEKIGLIYWLGRACEEQGKGGEARRLYERAMAVDIRFMDINERVSRLTTERT